jgi:hypothetical protein
MWGPVRPTVAGPLADGDMTSMSHTGFVKAAEKNSKIGK